LPRRADAECFLAERGDAVVGRITARVDQRDVDAPRRLTARERECRSFRGFGIFLDVSVILHL
jgi:hypothetical protein